MPAQLTTAPLPRPTRRIPPTSPSSSDPRTAIAALLRGESAQIVDEAVAHRLVEAAIDEHVGAVLARVAAGLPPRAAAHLADHARDRRVVTGLMDEELARVLDGLHARAVRPLVIKGAHLAHAIYASPDLRPRGDTDLLVSVADREAIAGALVELGYERQPHVRGSVILGQFHFRRTDSVGLVHAFDVHWRIAAPLVFTGVLPPEVLRGRAVALPSLGANAFGPSLPDALALACVHLCAHHRGGAILMWLYDLALLARALDTHRRAAFLDTAADAGVTALCAKALGDASKYFEEAPLAALAGDLAARGAGRREASARVLSISRPIDELWMDLRTPVSWRTRLTLLREHLLPDADYMRARDPRGWLPLAYARRAAAGACRWISDGKGRTAGRA